MDYHVFQEAHGSVPAGRAFWKYHMIYNAIRLLKVVIIVPQLFYKILYRFGSRLAHQQGTSERMSLLLWLSSLKRCFFTGRGLTFQENRFLPDSIGT